MIRGLIQSCFTLEFTPGQSAGAALPSCAETKAIGSTKNNNTGIFLKKFLDFKLKAFRVATLERRPSEKTKPHAPSAAVVLWSPLKGHVEKSDSTAKSDHHDPVFVSNKLSVLCTAI